MALGRAKTFLESKPLSHQFAGPYPPIEPTLVTVIQARSSVYPYAVFQFYAWSIRLLRAHGLYLGDPCCWVTMKCGQKGCHNCQGGQK